MLEKSENLSNVTTVVAHLSVIEADIGINLKNKIKSYLSGTDKQQMTSREKKQPWL